MRPDRTETSRTSSGVPAKVSDEHWFDSNCAARSVDIRMIDPPHNGSAAFREESNAIPSRPRFGSSESNCVGRQINGKGVYYQSNPGFRGVDRLSYLVSVGGGEWKRIEVQITVE
jgi:hypothetical protein